MLFPADILEEIRQGRVTVAFRRWKRPTVRAGGTLRTPVGVLAIDELASIEPDEVTHADARAAGFDSTDDVVASLRPRGLDLDLARGDEASRPRGRRNVENDVGPDVSDDGRALYRIRFRRVGDDPRAELRAEADLTTDEIAALDAQLDRWDTASRTGPWTARVLQLLDERPGTSSRVLADAVGVDQTRFKRRVRQLKDLGLTESLEVGYRLSPRGANYQLRTARPRR